MIYRAAMLGAAGASFSPDDITGLELWLDASDTSTITESSGAVSQWDDKSGNGNHVTQGTASAQPATGTTTINGKNVLAFDGSDFLATAAALGLSQPFTVFMALENGGTDARFIGARSFLSNRFRFSLESGNFGITGQNRIDAAAALGTSPAVTAGVANSASSSVRVDGATVASGDIGAVSENIGRIGAAFNDTLFFTGSMAEILVYSGALSSGDIASVESYLAAKWGVTLS